MRKKIKRKTIAKGPHHLRGLIHSAVEAQKRAYCPYSRFAVGAAVLTRNGSIFSGCNVESAAFNPSVHAEQTAIVSAIAHGVRPRDIVAIAVVGPAKEPITPCGICRQFMAEFSPPDDPIVLICMGAARRKERKIVTTDLHRLLPHQFPSPHDVRLIGR